MDIYPLRVIQVVFIYVQLHVFIFHPSEVYCAMIPFVVVSSRLRGKAILDKFSAFLGYCSRNQQS